MSERITSTVWNYEVLDRGSDQQSYLCRIAVTTPTLRPKSPRRGEMIEFLAQMPAGTMIFLTMAVLSLAATLIVLTRLN
jgi:hypothetical protein